ncbi:MAG: clan AA aspartic protease [Candidatus Cloacimonetes bacterium]|nr:clan AA aspartic protease [Candidatus Cloacimonadota bacterium]
MGLIYAKITLINGEDVILHRKGYLEKEKIRELEVKALVDSGAYMLAINEKIKTQLGLEAIDHQTAELANGEILKLEIVDPVYIEFENRSTTVRAMVLPGESEVLLGSIPMEDMDVVIEPRKQQLIVNPENPYLPKKPLKSVISGTCKR